jgi:fatty acid desaturase
LCCESYLFLVVSSLQHSQCSKVFSHYYINKKKIFFMLQQEWKANKLHFLVLRQFFFAAFLFWINFPSHFQIIIITQKKPANRNFLRKIYFFLLLLVVFLLYFFYKFINIFSIFIFLGLLNTVLLHLIFIANTFSLYTRLCEKWYVKKVYKNFKMNL